MFPRREIAGIAGVLAGIGLALEFVLFMASGWTPEVFGDPAAALTFLASGGSVLRAAAFVGFVNLGLTVVFIAGLAGSLQRVAPSRGSVLLYLGLIGIAAHALVPVGLWLGTPFFLELLRRDPAAAQSAWGGFAAFLDAAGGVGYLFDGVAFMAVGSALLSAAAPPVTLAWIGLVGGFASALTVVGSGTALEPLAGAAYLPALILIISFRIWGGVVLWRRDLVPEREGAGMAERRVT